MNEENPRNIPLDVIVKGRDVRAVLAEYQRIWDGAKEAATVPGLSPDDIFSDTMMIAAYRTYLLGVEDGMKDLGNGSGGMSDAEQYKASIIRLLELADDRKLRLIYQFVLHMIR